MTASILLLVCLAVPKYIAATVHTVIAGDTNDLITKLALVADHDVVLLPPGDYVFDLNYDPNIGGYRDGDLCGAMPTVSGPPWLAPDLLIRGTGLIRSDVKLVAALFENCNRNVVIENLSLYAVPTGPTAYVSAPVAEDGDKGTMLRNTYVQVPVIANLQSYYNYGSIFEALNIMSERIAVMYSTIETNPPVPSMGTNVGLTDGGGGVAVIKSTFAGFAMGLDLRLDCNTYYYKPWCQTPADADELNRDYKIYGNDLSQNTIGSDGDPNVISLLSPNTPKGQGHFVVNTIIDLLRYNTNYDAPYLPIKIRVKNVDKAGETTIYRVPSAYPEPLPGFISASEPQYYQFDSTASFKDKSKVFFKKVEIQSKFVGVSGSLTWMYHDGTTWSTISHVLFGGWYRIIFPTKKMNGLIAIFKN